MTTCVEKLPNKFKHLILKSESVYFQLSKEKCDTTKTKQKVANDGHSLGWRGEGG